MTRFNPTAPPSPPPYAFGAYQSGGHRFRDSTSTAADSRNKKGCLCLCLRSVPLLSILAFGCIFGGLGLMFYGSEAVLQEMRSHFSSIEEALSDFSDGDLMTFGLCGLGVMYILLMLCFCLCSGPNKERCCNSKCCRCLSLSSILVVMLGCVAGLLVMYALNCVFGTAAIASASLQLLCNDDVKEKISVINATQLCEDMVEMINDFVTEGPVMEFLEKQMNKTFAGFADGMQQQFGLNPAQMLRNSSLENGLLPNDTCTQIFEYCDDVDGVSSSLMYLVLGSFALFVGLIFSLVALGANWAHVYDYKPKKEKDSDFYDGMI